MQGASCLVACTIEGAMVVSSKLPRNEAAALLLRVLLRIPCCLQRIPQVAGDQGAPASTAAISGGTCNAGQTCMPPNLPAAVLVTRHLQRPNAAAAY